MRSLAKHSVRVNSVMIAATLLAATAGAVAAKDKYPVDANRYYGIYQSPARSLTPEESDHLSYQESGARGRQGLGGSPAHPEGPGGVAD